jgi:hypothetical protein
LAEPALRISSIFWESPKRRWVPGMPVTVQFDPH